MKITNFSELLAHLGLDTEPPRHVEAITRSRLLDLVRRAWHLGIARGTEVTREEYHRRQAAEAAAGDGADARVQMGFIQKAMASAKGRRD